MEGQKDDGCGLVREDAGFEILFWIEGCWTRISEGQKEELDFLEDRNQ